MSAIDPNRTFKNAQIRHIDPNQCIVANFAAGIDRMLCLPLCLAVVPRGHVGGRGRKLMHPAGTTE